MKKILLIFFGILLIIGIVQFVLNPSEFLNNNTTNETVSKNNNEEYNATSTTNSVKNEVSESSKKAEDNTYSIIEKNVMSKINELYGENASIVGLMHLRTEVENKIYYDGILGRAGYTDKDFTAVINKDDNSLLGLSVNGEIVY